MKKIKPAAFYIPLGEDKDWLLGQITAGTRFDFSALLETMQGEIFSNSLLQHFIDEEVRHDIVEVSTGHSSTLRHSSSGEQRKALLAHLIAKKPDYLIIDGVFESLDIAARQSVLTTLQTLSASTLIFQLFNRKNELLPFMDAVYCIRERAVSGRYSPDAFLQSFAEAGKGFSGSIPPPLSDFSVPKGPLVKMSDVSVQFNGRPILQHINWEINPGEFWQLSGPNGSGKSTLLALITGDSAKGYGQNLVLFGNRKGSGESVWEIKKMIGYFTPKMASQFERQDSIEQMIVSGFFDSVGLYLQPSDRQWQIARQWLAVIGMEESKKQPFRMLPQGKQRMVLVARAMVKHPPLLILDEPCSGLDDEMAALFTALIHTIAAQTNTAILYVSHKEEAGLSPDKVFQLSPAAAGSSGSVQQAEKH
jgi:molybdate transport system ATP-binding protein